MCSLAADDRPVGPAPSLWLHDRAYDLVWYGVVPLLAAAFFIASFTALGPARFLPVYLASSILTGYNHNMVTWLLILPRESRRHYVRGSLFWPATAAALWMVPVMVLYGQPAFAWALGAHIVIAFYHITRQHIGLLHAYDGRYIQATGDAAIRAWSADLRKLVGVVAIGSFTAKLAGAPIVIELATAPIPFPIKGVPVALPAVVGLLGLALLARLVWRGLARHRAGLAFPAGHAALAGGAIASTLVAAAIPNQHFIVTYSIVAACHNLQYLGFCYTHHHLRASATAEGGVFAAWARARRWQAWFGLPAALGVVFIALVVVVPPYWQSAIVLWFMMVHYLVDGAIWKRKNYPEMPRFGAGRPTAPALAPQA